MNPCFSFWILISRVCMCAEQKLIIKSFMISFAWIDFRKLILRFWYHETIERDRFGNKFHLIFFFCVLLQKKATIKSHKFSLKSIQLCKLSNFAHTHAALFVSKFTALITAKKPLICTLLARHREWHKSLPMLINALETT